MDGSKKLFRYEKDRVVAGVCGGLGEYLNLDPTLVRLIFILIIFFGGGGIIAYIVLWVVMPTESDIKKNLSSDEYIKKNSEELKVKAENFANEVSGYATNGNGRIIAGVIILVVGLGFLNSNFGFIFFDIWKLCPLILIGLGLFIIFSIKRN